MINQTSWPPTLVTIFLKNVAFFERTFTNYSLITNLCTIYLSFILSWTLVIVNTLIFNLSYLKRAIRKVTRLLRWCASVELTKALKFKLIRVCSYKITCFTNNWHKNFKQLRLGVNKFRGWQLSIDVRIWNPRSATCDRS